jgi:hypothetical protein
MLDAGWQAVHLAPSRRWQRDGPRGGPTHREVDGAAGGLGHRAVGDDFGGDDALSPRKHGGVAADRLAAEGVLVGRRRVVRGDDGGATADVLDQVLVAGVDVVHALNLDVGRFVAAPRGEVPFVAAAFREEAPQSHFEGDGGDYGVFVALDERLLTRLPLARELLLLAA